MCEEKTCSKCQIIKAITEFDKVKSGRYRSYCRPCGNEMTRAYKAKNKAKISEYNKAYKQEHKEEISIYNQAYNIEHREEIQARQTRTQKERKKVDPNFKISHALRNRLRVAIKDNDKCDHTFDLLGCSINFLKKWFEFLFEDGMTLDNHGPVWHIDHVIPCSLFDFTDPENQKRCFHWTNLQPLKALENIVKNNKITQKEIDLHETRIQSFIDSLSDSTENYTLIDYDKTKYVNKN